MSERNRRLAFIAGGLAAGLLLWLVAPEVYTGTFSDLGTFLRVLALILVLAGWVVLVRRFVDHRATALVLAGVPVLVAAWLFLWPYLRPPTEVDEAFPSVAAATPVTAATTTPSTTRPPTTTVPPITEVAPATTADQTAAPVATPTTTTPTTTTTTTTSTIPRPPVELRRATFQGLAGHRGSGDAAVYRLEDSSILLRFEDVDIGSGPALHVYLVPGADQRGTGGGVYVAALTAERGNQNYTPPDGVDITTGTWTVLVWCDTFTVEVANATLG
jgi:hypothetical protein